MDLCTQAAEREGCQPPSICAPLPIHMGLLSSFSDYYEQKQNRTLKRLSVKPRLKWMPE